MSSYGLDYIAILLIASLTEKPEKQQLVSTSVMGEILQVEEEAPLKGLHF